MKKILFALYLSLIFSVNIFATTLVGSLKLPDGTGVTGRLYLRIATQGAASTSGSCGGAFAVVPTTDVIFTVTNGALPGGAAVIGNDCISPANTYYVVRLRDNNSNLLFTENWTITGTTIDIGTIVPTSTAGTAFSGAVLLTPVSNVDQSIASNVLPSGTRNLGSSSAKWQDGWFSRSVQSAVDFRIGTAGGSGGLEALFLDSAANLAIGDPYTGSGRWDNLEFFPGTATYQVRVNRGGVQWATVATTPTCTASTGIIYFDGSALQMCNGTTGPTAVGSGSGGSSYFSRASGTVYPTTTTDRVLAGLSASDIADSGVVISNQFLYAVSGASNAVVGALGYDSGSTTIRLASGKTGSASYVPLAFLTNGTEQARITTTGSFLYQLTASDVSAPGFVSGQPITVASAATNASTFSMSVVAGSYGSLNAGRTGSGTRLPIAFFTGAAETARFDVTHNLLIGATTDDETTQIPLFVYRTNTAGTLILSRNDGTTTTSYAGIVARAGASASTNDITLGVTNASFTTSPLAASQSFIVSGAGSTGGLFVRTAANAPLIIGTNNVETARETGSGTLLHGFSSTDITMSAGEALFKRYVYVATAATNANVLTLGIDAGISDVSVLASGKTGSATYKGLRIRTGGTDWFGFETDGGLHIVGSSAGVSAVSAGAFRFNSGTNKMQVSENNGAWTNILGGFTNGTLVIAGSNNLSIVNLSVSTTGTIPYVMLETTAPDGTTVLIPAWKKP